MNKQCPFHPHLPDYRCPVCKHINQPTPTGEHYRNLFKPSPVVATAATITDRRLAGPSPLLCNHLGPDVGEEACSTCQGAVRLKIKSCAIHQTCTIGKPLAGKACCLTCPDKQVNFRKNLLYFIYPRSGSLWRWNVLRLLERIALFDGKRVVAIVTDRTTDPIDHVQNSLEGRRCEYITLENNPSLREVNAFAQMYSQVESRDPCEVTLYAHAKGVTRAPTSTAQTWAHALYELYLDYWPLVSKLLLRKPLVGAFKKVGHGWPAHESMSDWHYSGSWHWFRNADLFSRDWKKIDNNQWGIEPYPSLHFQSADAATIFYEAPCEDDANLYHESFWTKLEPQLKAWKDANKNHRLEVPYEQQF